MAVGTHQLEGLAARGVTEGPKMGRPNPCATMETEVTVERSFDRITQNPDVLAGRAAIRGLRISVAHVVNLVATGMTPAQVVAEIPDLEEEDVRQALGYAAALAQDEVHPIRA